MRSRLLRALFVCAAIPFASFLAYVVLQAISIPTASAYLQNFDGMGIPATATTPSTLPTDFRVDNPASVRTVGSFSAAATVTARAGGANLSSSAANGIYSFGGGTTALGNADRAVGFLSSGTATQSGNVYAQFTNNTGGDLSGLKISYDVEKYRLGINAAGFCVQLYYSTSGAAGTWTGAGANFLTTFPGDAGTVNSGYATVPGDLKSVSNQTLSIAIPAGTNIFLAWNYSVCSGSTTTNGQALAIDNISILGTGGGGPTNPSGTMTANAQNYAAGDSITLTVNVTPGTNPPSTGITVTGNLGSIGLGTPAFFDDGIGGGDQVANDNKFTFTGTIPSGLSGGTKSVSATIADSNVPQRTGTTPAISLTILAPTPPTGSGSANPGTVAPGGSTLLTITVTPGANPPSTGITVTGDLSAIGVAGPQAFTPAGGNSFTYSATVSQSTADGGKNLPITVADDLGRNSTFNLSLNVATPFVPSTLKISQVYGGGGNSGATYRNDFVELYNPGATAVDVTFYSVQVASATAGTWTVTPLCSVAPCVIQPGHYFLVQEGSGSIIPAQALLPAPDASGAIAMSAGNAKVALVGNASPLAGICPVGGSIVDFVGYGNANCSETAPAAGLAAQTADVRNGGGCFDTGNNSADFTEMVPTPRNSASPVHICGNGASLSASGLAVPSGADRNRPIVLTVRVTAPAGVGSVTADLSSIGGSAAQTFVDDGTSGDATAGDGTFSYGLLVPPFAAVGMHSALATVIDSVSQSVTEPIPFTVTIPGCGSERWVVKVGDDQDAPTVNQTPTPTTIAALRLMGPAPNFDQDPQNPFNFRFGPTELTTWSVNATMTLFKKESDSDYHVVLADSTDTVISEFVMPDCASDSSPFKAKMAAARATFDAKLSATPFFQQVSLPVQVTGVGFFDFIHGQTGVAPNGIELHPVLDITFLGVTTTTVSSSANPSKFGQPIDLVTAVTSTGPAPTGLVTFFDGGQSLGSATLDAQGHATFTTSSLSVGQHPLTANYNGDGQSIPSRSGAWTQTVEKADQTITFDPIPGKHFGEDDFTISATASSGLGVTLAVAGGAPATLSGTTVHLTGAGTVTIHATQDGDGNYNAAPPVDQSFEVAKASQTITFGGAAPSPTFGAQPFEVTAVGGPSGKPVTFTATGACAVAGSNGIAVVTIVSAGSCAVVASQAGNANYDAAPDETMTIAVGKATAEVEVEGVTVEYDGQPHGLTGSATGVKGENLSALLNLGAKFTNVPGGDIEWSFAGNDNYLATHGEEDVTITRATAAFSALASPSIEAGSASVVIGGTLGALVPTGTVAVTLNGVTLNAPIGANGHFSATFATGLLTVSGSPYAISFAYGGDTNFNGAAGTSSLTVVDTTAPSITAISATPNNLGAPNHQMIDVFLTYTATDASGAPVCIVGVSSNEPANGTGDGNTAADWIRIDEHHLQLRAERAGGGSGRIYTITVTCTDAAGHSTSNTTTVTVPK